MRHSRSDEFTTALAEAPNGGPRRWTDDAPDPNAAAALTRRADVLRAAWRSPIADRAEFLEQRCGGRKVMDIGCVAHDVARMSSPGWLHARLANVAASCVGVDVLDDGVAHMQSLGFTAVTHDLSTGYGPLAELAPFDVIIAGELIEHVESLDMLFRTAKVLLDPDGQLIITTPNPYAPHRVRAAQLGIVWENVDHIIYAFPSGMAELCERHGLVLAEAAVTVERGPAGAVDRLKAVKRRLRGRQWAAVGFSTVGQRRVQRVGYGYLVRLLSGMRWPRRKFLGETFVYVVRRAGAVPHGNPR